VLSSPAFAELFVCASDSVRVFADDAGPNDPPIRIIAGTSTGITECYDVALDIKNDELYVATGSVNVFPAGASGNVTPTRQINASTFACSVAVDFQTNELFVGSTGPVLSTYSRTASGMATPLVTKNLIGADTPIALFVNRFRSEMAASGFGSNTVYFFDPATLNPSARPTLGLTAPRGLFAGPAQDELFVAVPGGVKVFGWNGPLHRTIGSVPTSYWGIGITAGSELWATVKSQSQSMPDQMFAYLSTTQTAVLGQLNQAAPLTKEARGIAVSAAADCGAGHVACDSLFWDGFQFRRD
jgi:DNA-binding beta-propeller fold protein YncE